MNLVNLRTDEIHIRDQSDQDKISMEFHLLGDFHVMSRPYGETFDKFIKRFSSTCSTKMNKLSKGKKSTRNKVIGKINVGETAMDDNFGRPKLFHNGKEFMTENMLISDLVSGMIIGIDSLSFTIVKNPPTVVCITAYPKSVLIVGCPIVPTVTTDFADDFRCCWMSETSPQSKEYKLVSSDKIYVPTSEVVGCKIKLYCNAVRFHKLSFESDPGYSEGRSVVLYLPGVIENRPDCFNEMLLVRENFNNIPRRHGNNNTSSIHGLFSTYIERNAAVTQVDNYRDVDELRILSYNILAEPFATSAHSINCIYKYCNSIYLESEYRVQRIMAELIASDADIICLQECDSKYFDLYFCPLLGYLGYAAHFTGKINMGLEGCAVFTLQNTCKVLQRIDLPLKNVLRDHPYLLQSGFYQLPYRPDLQDVIGGRLGTIAQFTVIESLNSSGNDGAAKTIILANTHLFYHPTAGIVRLLQTHAILQALEQIKTDILSHHHPNNHAMEVSNDDDNSDVMQALNIRLFGEEVIDIDTITSELSKQNSLRNGCMKSSNNCNLEGGDNKVTDKTNFIRLGKYRNKRRIYTVFAGDLNSTPSRAVFEYITKGSISLKNFSEEWLLLQQFGWGDREANFNITTAMSNTTTSSKAAKGEEGADSDGLTQSNSSSSSMLLKDDQIISTIDDPLKFRDLLTHKHPYTSAAGLPAYSNYTATFKELLDYIFIHTPPLLPQPPCIDSSSSDGLGYCSVIRVSPFPDEDTLSAAVGLPSAVFPSDHIAIAVDVKLL